MKQKGLPSVYSTHEAVNMKLMDIIRQVCFTGSTRPVGPRWAAASDAGNDGHDQGQNAHGELC